MKLRHALPRRQDNQAAAAWDAAQATALHSPRLADHAEYDRYPPSLFFQGMKFMFFGNPMLRFAHAAHKLVAERRTSGSLT